MMDNLIPEAILAIFTAWGVVAAKYPHAFKRLFGRLYFLVSLALLLMIVWNGGASIAFSHLSPFVKGGRAIEASAAIEEIKAPSWAFVIIAVFIIYIFLLAYFVGLMEEKQEQTESNSE